MKNKNYYIIPDLSELSFTHGITTKYKLGWEYNEFCMPEIYEDEKAVDSYIEEYMKVRPDRSHDTMHGAFLGVDISASDSVLRSRSKDLCEQSLSIAKRLGIEGVIFHTGLIGSLRVDYYLNNWLDCAENFWKDMCEKYKGITIYLENSFEKSPDIFVKIMDRMQGVDNFKLCLDYGHAVISDTSVEEWCRCLAPFIGHMHLNDNDLTDDLHLPIGKGKVDFSEYLSLMERYNINVGTLLEVKGKNNIEESLNALEMMGY